MELLLEYLLPYTKLSYYIPSEMEIKSLASSLPQEKKEKVEELLRNSRAETRKALYFLFKIKETSLEKKPYRIDAEETAYNSVKSAATGLFLSWFREIYEGRGKYLKNVISPGLFSICYTVYSSGKAYYELEKKAVQESTKRTQTYYMVVRKELDTYRNEIYNDTSKGLFEFYTKNIGRMKKIERLHHLSQKFLSYEESFKGAGCVLSFANSFKGSPWLKDFSQKILQEYKHFFSKQIIKWIKGDVQEETFIKEKTEKGVTKYIVVEEDIPKELSIQTVQELVYIGKTGRLISSLFPEEYTKIMRKIETTSIGCEDSISAYPSHTAVNYQDIGWIFQKDAVTEIFKEIQGVMENSFFVSYKIFYHLQMIRDVFLLFREDFFNELIRNISEKGSLSELSFLVDETIEKCFGRGFEHYVDIVEEENRLILAYIPSSPFTLFTANIKYALSNAFKFFWEVRLSLFHLHEAYLLFPSKDTLHLRMRSLNLQYAIYEEIIGSTWNFENIPTDILYDTERFSSYIEETLQSIIDQCMCVFSPSLLPIVTDALASKDQNEFSTQIPLLLQMIPVISRM
ncbi:hypothetical protein NEFER03_1864 [Nematocida sp. LUAm3]|nr:hypothetical protein NEFER03_1864 [Nematocida sp. LUAm3]